MKNQLLNEYKAQIKRNETRAYQFVVEQLLKRHAIDSVVNKRHLIANILEHARERV